MNDLTKACCDAAVTATKMMSVKDTLDDIERKLFETNAQLTQILGGLEGEEEVVEKMREALNMRDQAKSINDMADRIMKIAYRIGENLF